MLFGSWACVFVAAVVVVVVVVMFGVACVIGCSCLSCCRSRWISCCCSRICCCCCCTCCFSCCSRTEEEEEERDEEREWSRVGDGVAARRVGDLDWASWRAGDTMRLSRDSWLAMESASKDVRRARLWEVERGDNDKELMDDVGDKEPKSAE